MGLLVYSVKCVRISLYHANTCHLKRDVVCGVCEHVLEGQAASFYHLDMFDAITALWHYASVK